MHLAVEFLAEQLREYPGVLQMPWANEGMRWTELVFCVLYRVYPDAAAARSIIALTAPFPLFNAQVLVEPTPEQRTVLEYLFQQAGWPAEFVAPALSALSAMASTLALEGGLTQILRREAEAMRDRIVTVFPNIGGDNSARDIVTHWLQNTCNLPILLNTIELETFASRAGCSLQELVAASDSLDLNLAVLDDLALAAGGADGQLAR